MAIPVFDLSQVTGIRKNSTTPPLISTRAGLIDGTRPGGGDPEPTGGYTITGTGFGTKPAGLSVFEDFESLDVGTLNGSGSELTQTGTDTLIANSSPYSGTKHALHDYSQKAFPEVYKVLSGEQTRFYLSCYFRWSGTVEVNTVWKFGRIGANAVYLGAPRVGESYTSTNNTPTGFGGEIVSSDGGFGGSSATLHPSPSSIYTADAWHFYEIEFYTGTVDGSDSYFRALCDGVEMAIWDGLPFLTTENSALPVWVLTPINGLDLAPSVVMLMDNVYVDESRARVVMTDNAVYANSTQWAVQPIATYSDTEVTVSKKRQGFTVGATAYLHLFNNAGNLVSEGNQVTVEADA